MFGASQPPFLQTPAMQFSSLAQALPQLPQLAGSVEVSTQTPEQSVLPLSKQEQVPEAQLKPLVVSQALSHAPQCELSLCRSTQEPLQSVLP